MHMDIRASVANLAWAGASQQAWRRFRSALGDPLRTQRATLVRYLRDNQHTLVGRSHRFERLLSAHDIVEAYQSSVPVTTYDDLEPFIRSIAAGNRQVLTRAPVLRFAPSSGSTSAAKLVPQTQELQKEFNLAVDAWVADLYRRQPSLILGPAYWSVTPAISFEAIAAARLGPSTERAAVPVGFDDDSAYLGGVRQQLVRAMLVMPDEVRRIADPEVFRYVTLLFLVRARGLRLISVWHPSFLARLMDAIPTHLERLIVDLARGTLTPPGPLAADVQDALAGMLRPAPRRAAALRRLSNPSAREVWPDLMLVSCWGDGPAAPYASRLARELPGVFVQRKGLIATEAIVTIPFGGLHPLAIRSHFFEFLDPQGQYRLAHELARDVEYTPIVTTGGGLYRYRLGDRVVVDGWIEGTPSLRFVGRGDRVSDRFGEKLSDGFVASVLAGLFEGSPPPRFAMLTPETTAGKTAYTLLVEPDSSLPRGLATSLERALRKNPHYAWCVDLGQLRPARVVRVGPGADRAYVDACVAKGQRLGDVKPVSLHTDSGWEETLRGQ
jgi:hypothetical protein